MKDRVIIIIGSALGGSSSQVVHELFIGGISLAIGCLSAFLGAIIAFYTTRFLKKKYA